MKKQNRKSWTMAYCGMAAALCVALMLLGAVIPIAMFIAPALAGFLIATVCVECGRTMALTAYAAVSLLALLFVPDKEVALIFVFLLGYYPLAKPRFDRIRPAVLRCVCKLLLCNAAVLAMYGLLLVLIPAGSISQELRATAWIVTLSTLAMGNVAFLLYDRALHNLLMLYRLVWQPKLHRMLTMRPLDERGAWAAKSKKEYDLDENGERIRLPSGRYKTHKVDLTGWNDKDNTLLWRRAWADYTNDFLERNGSPERIDHRSNAERGIDEIPTVHMGVAACQMEKKGIATEKGALNRSIQKTNRLIREIRAQISKLKEWIADLFKARETAPEQPPQSPNLANLLMKYLSVQREKSRKYSQSWQRQHATDELKTIAAAVNYLSEHGISNLDELDASLSSVSDRAYSIREGMKTAEQRMKELQKLMEYGRNYQTYKPIQDEYRQIRWKGKQEKFAEARRAELTLWDAANRYLHANLPKGTKTLPIAEWEQEYADLKTQRDSDYTKLKDTRAEVAELQKIRKCVDIALRADQPEQTQNRAKRHEQER